MKTYFVLSGQTTENSSMCIIGNKSYRVGLADCKQSYTLKSLSAKYLKFAINESNRSERKFAIKVRGKSTTPNKFKFSALQYRYLKQAPGDSDFEEYKYALPPDGRIGDGTSGFVVLSPNAQNWTVISKDFNEKHQAVFLVAAATDFIDREPRSLELEVAFQALGKRDLKVASIIEPTEPVQVASNVGLPNPLLLDERPKMVIEVPGCLRENCKMAFEHKQAGQPDIIVPIPADRIIDLE